MALVGYCENVSLRSRELGIEIQLIHTEVELVHDSRAHRRGASSGFNNMINTRDRKERSAAGRTAGLGLPEVLH
jgi:hypothetical protein